MATEVYIGAGIEREDSRAKCTGSAFYATDFYPKDCLQARILRSPEPHARILSIDVEEAARAEGIEAVVTSRDYPNAYWGYYLRDQTIFADDKVHCVGEPVAAVVGRDEEALETALARIRVSYESLLPVFDVREAMSGDSVLIHENMIDYERDRKNYHPVPETNICNHFKIRRGDVREGFRSADFVFEDTYQIPMVHHCAMEPHACVGLFEPTGKLTLWTSTQGPFRIRQQVADAMGLAEESVRVVVPYCGGGFGGKVSACAEVLCAAVAKKVPKRPVRLVFEREEVFESTFVRQAFFAEYKTGVTRDGTIVAREAKLIWDTGAFGDYEVAVSRAAGQNAAGPYRTPHVHVDSYCVYTNKPKAGAYRGFGAAEVCFCYEQQMDRIARELKLDPVEIRLRNLVHDGDEAVTGQKLVGVGVTECLRKVSESLGPLEGAPHNPKGKKRRGKGLACMVKSSGAPLHSGAEIAAKEDGTFLLKVSAVEHGQGVHTILRQIAAEELRCGIERIQVADIDTDLSPPSSSTSASKTTFFDGNAVQLAAKDLRREMLKVASEHLEVSPEDLEMNAGKVFPRGVEGRSLSVTELLSRVPASGRLGDGEVIAGKASFRLEDATSLDPETGQGKRASSFMMYAAQGVEVEVDLETGQVDVLSMFAAHDVGRAINLKGCEAQIEGALIQGLGISLFEEMRFEEGTLINGNLSEYRIPCTLDVPGMTPMVVEAPIPDGPWGAKGVGEPGLVPTAAAIGNAVFSAIGCQIKTLPFNPELVLETLSSAQHSK